MENDFFKRIETVLDRPYHGGLYVELYEVLHLVCEQFVDGRFCSDFFSLLGVVCDTHDIPSKMAARLQGLRRRAGRIDRFGDESEETDESQFLSNALLLAQFVARLYGCGLPPEIERFCSAMTFDEPCPEPMARRFDVLRVRVVDIDENHIVAEAEEDLGVGFLDIPLKNSGDYLDFSYLSEFVEAGSVLNLLKVGVDAEGRCEPRQIIFEPDYLMSPSEVAGVFELHGASPYNYFIRLFSPSPVTEAILLGNVSGVFLDDLLGEAREARVGGDAKKLSYADSLARAFRRSPLDFSLLMTDSETSRRFHTEARRQFDNIRRLFENYITPQQGFDLDKALLEPSFVCPAVGLAGRMDYLQSDGTRLIEQKSGKRDEFRATHREPHFVQMMLYRLMMEYTPAFKNKKCETFLLYSRYEDGLMSEHTYFTLLNKAIEMRNRIVSMIYVMANGRVTELMNGVKAEDLRIEKISDRLWQPYILPRIEKVLSLFSKAEEGDVACVYATRFISFVMRENLLAKTGARTKGRGGYSDLWNTPPSVRVENGEMFADLRLVTTDEVEGKVSSLTFSLTDNAANGRTNFRWGDAVQIYSYDNDCPFVSNSYILRGRLGEVTTERLTVELNNPQHESLFEELGDKHFALEHDHVDSSTTTLCRSLFAFMDSPIEKQANFLLTKMPAQNPPAELKGDYAGFNSIVAMERAADSWFLLIGPPGSGKTSCALRYMIEEELRADTDSRLLLMAYTNRAVDELCMMLEEIIKDTPQLLDDYLRLGHTLSGSPRFNCRTLDGRPVEECGSGEAVRRLLKRVRVVVATISTMSLQQMLLANVDFSVAFVDEASQILEPYLLPIYTVVRVDKYVLVGDQKQLPAVVVQDSNSSTIDDSDLNSLEIYDCAESLFSRMLHTFMECGRTDLYCQINTQGRMHPDLFGFVNHNFYGDTLRCVPLGHQTQSLDECYPRVPRCGGRCGELVSRLLADRILFLDCKPCDDGLNDKTNSAEANLVALCIEAFAKIYEVNGRELLPDDIGVIVPYRNQICQIKTSLRQC
ncbi:MAG: AAA domain-containing protein, partial [Bacteroidaceae bacterium]